MNRSRLILLVLAVSMVELLLGCDANKCNKITSVCIDESPIDSFGKSNIDVIGVGTVNYTANAIYGIHILQPDKNDIAGAGRTSGQQGTPAEAQEWSRRGASGASLAWDKRWAPPYKFKIWWEHVYDAALYAKSGPYPKGGGMFDPYDPYTTKQTRPGSAWCEYEIVVNETYNEPYGDPFPGRFRDTLSLYFYPDGTVQGHLLITDEDKKRNFKGEDIFNRNQLAVLRDKACIKEIANPYYGKRKPIIIN